MLMKRWGGEKEMRLEAMLYYYAVYIDVFECDDQHAPNICTEKCSVTIYLWVRKLFMGYASVDAFFLPRTHSTSHAHISRH